MPLNVYGIGNALVDVQARVPDELLTRIGYEKGVMTLVDDSVQIRVLSELGEIDTFRCAGGSAANTILGVQQFGGKAAYAGKTAADDLGEFFLKDMREAGVLIEVPPAAEGHTGTCVVLITEDAERTMLTHLGVSAELGEADVVNRDLDAAEWIYVEGYLFGTPDNQAAARAAIREAKQAGVKVALTVSDPFLVNAFKADFLELIGGPVDLLFCNLEEARGLTGKESARDCADALAAFGPRIALTMGKEGSVLVDPLGLDHVPGVPVKAIDTTGAGDMYAAGMLYGITNGLEWEQAGRLGSLAAAKVVGQMGARLAQPISKSEIAAAIRN
ncbi:adenosine kinase [Alienimonas californiensis]|uniref:Putative sugar kinase YdjH n=1 Tax=Alienimonas californiensis TaxID=2527989 RepID=A0A517PCK7_9PLAN|nr:adenosine kinase [Alienimonas californiensis]QDT17071.1 putative sugar kinase YdjH [Alienimonas californiensis]